MEKPSSPVSQKAQEEGVSNGENAPQSQMLQSLRMNVRLDHSTWQLGVF